VFAAYGEYLYAWNAIDGASKGVSITELPYAKVNICNFTTVAPTPFEDTETSSNSTMSQELCFFSQPKPVIVALLLHDQRLTAIVSEDNYLYSSSGETFSYSSSGEILLTKRTPKIITDYTKLTILIYDISSVPLDDSPLTLIAKSEKPIMAGYSAAVSKKNSGVLAATAYIDSSSLVYDLYRFSTQYCGLNSTEYKKLAMETASNNRTETFVESMLEELQLQLNGTCESIVQVRMPISYASAPCNVFTFRLIPSSTPLPPFLSPANSQFPLMY
jgi:DNA excision repair protein ERCC-4